MKEVCIELLQIEIKFDVMEDLYDICNKGNEKMKFIGYINLIIMKKDSLSLEECNVIEKFFREKEEYIGSDIARNLYDIIKKFKRGGNKGGFIENREYIGNKEIQLSKLEHKEKNWGFFENNNISESDITGKVKTKEIVVPRQISMYLCRKILNMNDTNIGKEFGKDRTTVGHNIEKIEESIDTNSTIKSDVNYILKDLNYNEG